MLILYLELDHGKPKYYSDWYIPNCFLLMKRKEKICTYKGHCQILYFNVRVIYIVSQSAFFSGKSKWSLLFLSLYSSSSSVLVSYKHVFLCLSSLFSVMFGLNLYILLYMPLVSYESYFWRHTQSEGKNKKTIYMNI